VGLRQVIAELQAAGYNAELAPKSDKNDIRTIVNETVQKYRRRFILSLAFQVPILILMWVLPYAWPEFTTKWNEFHGVPLLVLLTCFFATLIQFIIGAPFYESAYKAIKHKSANMDVLIMLGTTSAWAYGVALIGVGYSDEEMHDHEMYEMAVKEHSHNFEISSVLITIILLGKVLESISKKKTVDKLS